MKKLLVCVALIAPVSFAWAQKVDPNKLPQVACTDLKFSQAFLDKYPNAPAACLEGRVYKGVKYGKFDAKVYIQSLPQFITLQFLNSQGTEMPNMTFSIKPRPGAVVYRRQEDQSRGLEGRTKGHFLGPGEQDGGGRPAGTDAPVVARHSAAEAVAGPVTQDDGSPWSCVHARPDRPDPHK